MPFYSLRNAADTKINYEEFSDRIPQTTLFIHGNAASNRWWYPAESQFREQYKDGEFSGSMLLAEIRGCGQSTAPNHKDEIGLHRLADDFIELVASLNRGPINLVGHSAGGFLSALMLAKAPELFNRAVLLDPVGVKGVLFNESAHSAYDAMKKNKNLLAMVMAGTIYQNDNKSEFFNQVIVEDAFRAMQNVGIWLLQNLDRLDIEKEVRSIPHPCLVLHGEFDQLLPLRDSQSFAELLPKGQFQMIPGQGHCANVENPRLFAQIISKFLFER